MASKGPSEADVIFNRANVALARSQRLIQSWLPPRTAEELASAKTEEELQREDDALFKPAPELLGVGAAVPDEEQNSLVRRKGPASNQRLLEQLLGKKAAKGHIASSKAPNRHSPSLNSNQLLSKPVDESDDEEEGRASMVASNSTRRGSRMSTSKAQPAKSQTTTNSTTAVQKTPIEKERGSARMREKSSDDEEDARPTRKRPLSYMDQLLAEKASKKKKKKQEGSNKG